MVTSRGVKNFVDLDTSVPIVNSSSETSSGQSLQVNILNLPIDNVTKKELLERLETGVIFTPNVDHLIRLQYDPEFLKVYGIADYKICDSKIVYYASRFLGSPICEKISGSDFFVDFYEHHRNNPNIRIFLLGGAEGVAEQARQRINAKVGREIIIGAHSPSFGFERNPEECQKIVELINQSGANVLAIGVGAPKQEKWIYRHRAELSNIRIFMAVGATIDFEAGNKQRAPKWMSEVGMEWFFRLLTEPRRLWKRYLVDDTRFFWLILQQKLNLYKVPFEYRTPDRCTE